jgi:hypothetical protein
VAQFAAVIRPISSKPTRGLGPGWFTETEWVWADFTSMVLEVEVFSPSSTIAPNKIEVYFMPWEGDIICNRN